MFEPYGRWIRELPPRTVTNTGPIPRTSMSILTGCVLREDPLQGGGGGGGEGAAAGVSHDVLGL